MLGERCSHGKLWAEQCPECDLVAAKDFVQRWGPLVDEARAKIAEAINTLIDADGEAEEEGKT